MDDGYVEAVVKQLKYLRFNKLTEPTLSSPGQLSYTACKSDEKPILHDIPLRFCVPIIPNNAAMIFKPATCPNGQPALIAFYEGVGMCVGDSITLAKPTQETQRQCFSYNNFTSWEFWCESSTASSQVSDLQVHDLSAIGIRHARPSSVYLWPVMICFSALSFLVFGIWVWFLLTPSLKVRFTFQDGNINTKLCPGTTSGREGGIARGGAAIREARFAGGGTVV